MVDKCEDGVGRYVCPQNTPRPTARPTTSQPTSPGQVTKEPTTKAPTTKSPTQPPTTKSPTSVVLPPVSIATFNPSKAPTARPSRDPTPKPSAQPTISLVTAAPTEQGETLYVVQVTTQVIWLTFLDDYGTVDNAIEELMYQTLAAKYVGITATVSDDKQILGPYESYYYTYGFNTVPMILQGVNKEQSDQIQTEIKNGHYAEELCTALSTRFQSENPNGLRCYRVTASIDSITAEEYSKFIGDVNDDGVPFDTLNLESYSTADIFVLVIFLLFICCACWCIGWYSHKKKFQKELEKELNLAANFNQQQQETDIRRQMAANAQPDIFQRGIGRFRNN